MPAQLFIFLTISYCLCTTKVAIFSSQNNGMYVCMYVCNCKLLCTICLSYFLVSLCLTKKILIVVSLFWRLAMLLCCELVIHNYIVFAENNFRVRYTF